MNKYIITSFCIGLSLFAVSQNDNNLGNEPGNVSNLNNPATPIQSQVNYSNTDNAPLQVLQGNKSNVTSLDNNLDNKVDIPQQQQAYIPNGNEGNQSKDLSFDMPKLSFGTASAGGGHSSGKKHHSDFSRKMKKLNRKLSYVLAKKNKGSFRVDNCFAWAK